MSRFHHKQKTVVRSVNTEPIWLIQLHNLLGLSLSDATNLGILEELFRQFKILCSVESQICRLSLQLQGSLLATARNVFTLFLWKLEDSDEWQLF